MANLIIKSSADNLVLQGSDASPAITVGATGTTTFSENMTLSGTANNLGTSTAGTFTSGITYPAGHVIQTVTASLTAQSGSITAQSDTRRDNMTAQITNVKSGNKVNIRMNFNFYIDMGDSADGGSCSIFRENTVISKHNGGHAQYFSNYDLAIYTDQFLEFTDASPAVGTNNYYLGMRAYSNCTVLMENSAKFNIILQEIQG